MLCWCYTVFRVSIVCMSVIIFFFKQKTAYEMRISDWSSDVCSSDLEQARFALEKGVPDALVQENGDLVRLAPGPARIVERVRSGRLLLDGDVKIGRASCRERVCQYV